MARGALEFTDPGHQTPEQEIDPVPPSDTQLVFDPIVRQTILVSALYLSTALGGVLAYVYGARFGRLGLAVAITSAALLLSTTALRAPLLVPVALIGLGCTVLAGRSIARERANH
jgi:hypothetical protein